MASDPSLTPYERKLCIMLTMLSGGVVAFTLLPFDEYLKYLGTALRWAHEQGGRVFAGDPPELSRHNLARFLLICTLIGTLFLGAESLAHLTKSRSWLRPRTLWFWTTIHFTLPVMFGLLYWSSLFMEIDLDGLSYSATERVSIFLVTFVVPLPLLYASLHAWRQRRQETKAETT